MKYLTLVICTIMAFTADAQLRSMFDVPSIYLTSRDIENIPQEDGLGLDFGYGFGTHFFVTKFSVGVNATADFDSKVIDKTVFINPFGRVEIGLGKWRSNGQKCAKTNSNAYTILAKGGLVYNFGKKKIDVENKIDPREANLDYFVGAEIGMFFIKDMHKNSEYFLTGGYMLESKKIFAELGIRTFLNTRYSRS